MPPLRAATPIANLAYESQYWAQGIRHVAGVDEAGRGPLVACVTAASCILAPGADPAAFTWAKDSKTLSSARITEAATAIRAGAYQEAGLLAWGLGCASPREIDRHNIRIATILAMQRALTHATRMLQRTCPDTAARGPGMVLVDGVPLKELGWPHEAIVKGDAKSISIAIASILAKECRDRLMDRLAVRYPAFACWSRDAGYGSPAHLSALTAHGPTPHHRMSFAPVRASVRP
jgi:ribonuclease HII